MRRTGTTLSFERMDLDEKIEHVQDLWDRIAERAAADPRSMPLTDPQREELDRRLAEHERDPGAGVSWEEARERIRRSLR